MISFHSLLQGSAPFFPSSSVFSSDDDDDDGGGGAHDTDNVGDNDDGDDDVDKKKKRFGRHGKTIGRKERRKTKGFRWAKFYGVCKGDTIEGEEDGSDADTHDDSEANCFYSDDDDSFL